MAMDMTWLLSAKDNASGVFDKVKQSGEGAAKGVESAFGGVMNKFNLLTGAVGAMATIAAGGVFKSVIKETIEWTGEAVALSKSLGITTQQASILNVALGDVYLSKDTMLAGSARIAKALKTEEEAFTRLGVATRDQSGHYRNTLDIMTDVNTKLGSLKEGTDRNVAGMSIYGKSWGELSGLIKLNNGVMEEATRKAKELGLMVGEEQVANMKKYKAAMNDIEDVGKSLVLRFGNVLLPALVKVGAFLGNNGPVLATAFQWSLNALGFTVSTLGEWLGLLAYRAVSMGSIIKSVFTGNFADARQEYNNMVAAGEDFNKRVKAAWSQDWTKDKPLTSKASKGDQLDVDFGKEDKLAAALKAKIDLWKDAAKKILEVEKDRIATLLTIEKEYLTKIKANYDQRVNDLKTFQDGYNTVLDSIAARDKASVEEKAAALRVNEDSYTKYYRMRHELQAEETKLDNDPAWSNENVLKKVKAYDDQITKAKALYDLAKAGQIDNVSAEQAESDYLITKSQLETKIKDLGAVQIKQQEDLAVKAAESITIMERAIKVQEDQIKIVEHMLKNINNVTEKELRIKVTGMDDLYRVQALNATTGGQHFGDYYTMGGKTYWANGELAEDGISVAGGRASGGPVEPYATYRINENGTEYLTMGSKGGYITPSGQTPPGQGITIQGGITISLPNVTDRNTADDLARLLLPKLQELSRRKAA